jgi:hypothetical protein
MVKKSIIAVVIVVGISVGALEYKKVNDAEQEKYDTFIGLQMPDSAEEGFFSRTKDDLSPARTANISSRGDAFRIARDQDGYRDVISRKSYAGNTIVQAENYWKLESKDRIATLYMAFQMHCTDSYIQYMQEEKNMPQDNFIIKEIFIGSATGYYPTEEDRSMSSNMKLMVAYGKHAWGNYSTKEYAVELKCSMDIERKIQWQAKGY